MCYARICVYRIACTMCTCTLYIIFLLSFTFSLIRRPSSFFQCFSTRLPTYTCPITPLFHSATLLLCRELAELQKANAVTQTAVQEAAQTAEQSAKEKLKSILEQQKVGAQREKETLLMQVLD